MSVATKWQQPQKVSQIDVAFGGDMKKLLPTYATLPEEFRRDTSPWCKVVDTWFFKGIDPRVFSAKDGINRVEAFAHLKAVMASWEPKHEHKISGVAYLMSLWFEPTP